MTATWLDRVAEQLAPRWQLKRLRARMASDLIRRHYEAAAGGRRTQGWRKSGGDANALIGPALATLRSNARDLVRNNPYAESALATIADHTVGWGIEASPQPKNQQASDVWREWAETTACDADGRHDFYGLQKLVKRTVVESGEVLIRRRFRRILDDGTVEGGLPLPIQLQVLDPDFLDTSKDTAVVPASSGGGTIIQGVQFDGIGRRIGYWLFREHPGSTLSAFSGQSVFVPADSVLHVFRPMRPGQVRGVSWFAPVLLRFRDFDEFEDATLMKQKIAACLAVFYTDTDGTASGMGTLDPAKPELDMLEPGLIKGVPPGMDIKVVEPPRTNEYDAYSRTVLRAIATGLGVTYEDLTGDYQDMPFSAARMSKLRHEARINDWRWRILIPQFCDPAWAWAMQSAAIMRRVTTIPAAKWTPPPLPMVDPANEGLAAMRNMRIGITSLYEEIRARGYDPDDLLQEIKDGNTKLDELGIVLDSDPRKMTQAGQTQAPAQAVNPIAPGVDDDDEPETDERRLRTLTMMPGRKA